MSDSHAIIGLAVKDSATLPCMVEAYCKQAWLLKSAGIQAWGAGRHSLGEILLRMQPGKTRHDLFVRDLTGDIDACIVVAHASLEGSQVPYFNNIQPYRIRNWLFTLEGDQELVKRRAQISAALPAYLLYTGKRMLNSEALFLHFLFMSHLGHANRKENPALLSARLREVVEQTESPINVLATDGKILLACCFGKPMYYRFFEGIKKCPRCRLGPGQTRLASVVESHKRAKGFCVTSMPFGVLDKWQQIPKGRVLVVLPSLQIEMNPQSIEVVPIRAV